MTQAVTEENAYTPENINRQLLLGVSRDELAVKFGHKSFKSLDMFMRKHGYLWNRDKQFYEVKAKKPNDDEELTSGPKKLMQILSLFEKGKDPKEVAKEVGFKNHLALAEYMKEKNYIWNHKSHCYELQGGEFSRKVEEKLEAPVGNNNDEEMLQVLLKNKDKLYELLKIEDSKNLPRYSLSGIKIAKTVHMAHKLNELIKQFAEEKNISQREFLELAAIEAMRKYGYEAEVKAILS